SKKKSNQVEALKKDFINGAMKLKYTEKLANQVYELIMKFANYGFNKSHSVAYALICYQMAYLKANKPTLFFVSLLNSVIVNDNKTVEYILEARMIGIKILGPDINLSTNKYEIEDNNIRCPLTLIKGLARNTVVSIMKEKEENGIFKDFYTAVSRLYKYEVKDKTLEAMINAGVFDLIHNNRATLIASCKEALKLANLVNGNENQVSFDLAGGRHELINVKENNKQRVLIEKEYLGFYLGEHPLFTLRKNYADVKSIIETKNRIGYAKILGQIDRIKQHRTKRGDVMAFVNVSDDTGSFDLVIMPDLYARRQKILVKGQYILASGRIEKENSCLVKEINEIK
ncbi:MAG: DNA polymerase III subunit alpha, partial [Erysipelotrichaceae bacterium]